MIAQEARDFCTLLEGYHQLLVDPESERPSVVQYEEKSAPESPAGDACGRDRQSPPSDSYGPPPYTGVHRVMFSPWTYLATCNTSLPNSAAAQPQLVQMLDLERGPPPLAGLTSIASSMTPSPRFDRPTWSSPPPPRTDQNQNQNQSPFQTQRQEQSSSQSPSPRLGAKRSANGQALEFIDSDKHGASVPAGSSSGFVRKLSPLAGVTQPSTTGADPLSLANSPSFLVETLKSGPQHTTEPPPAPSSELIPASDAEAEFKSTGSMSRDAVEDLRVKKTRDMGLVRAPRASLDVEAGDEDPVFLPPPPGFSDVDNGDQQKQASNGRRALKSTVPQSTSNNNMHTSAAAPISAQPQPESQLTHSRRGSDLSATGNAPLSSTSLATSPMTNGAASKEHRSPSPTTLNTSSGSLALGAASISANSAQREAHSSSPMPSLKNSSTSASTALSTSASASPAIHAHSARSPRHKVSLQVIEYNASLSSRITLPASGASASLAGAALLPDQPASSAAAFFARHGRQTSVPVTSSSSVAETDGSSFVVSRMATSTQLSESLPPPPPGPYYRVPSPSVASSGPVSDSSSRPTTPAKRHSIASSVNSTMPNSAMRSTSVESLSSADGSDDGSAASFSRGGSERKRNAVSRLFRRIFQPLRRSASLDTVRSPPAAPDATPASAASGNSSAAAHPSRVAPARVLLTQQITTSEYRSTDDERGVGPSNDVKPATTEHRSRRESTRGSSNKKWSFSNLLRRSASVDRSGADRAVNGHRSNSASAFHANNRVADGHVGNENNSHSPSEFTSEYSASDAAETGPAAGHTRLQFVPEPPPVTARKHSSGSSNPFIGSIRRLTRWRRKSVPAASDFAAHQNSVHWSTESSSLADNAGDGFDGERTAPHLSNGNAGGCMGNGVAKSSSTPQLKASLTPTRHEKSKKGSASSLQV